LNPRYKVIIPKISKEMKMKICIITPRFTVAGVPLAQLRFARAFVNQGHNVDLIIGWIDPRFKLPELKNINVVIFNKQKVRDMLLPFKKYLQINNPNLVFSAEDHLNAIVLTGAIISRSTAKISCSSRVTPFDTYSNKILSKKWILKQWMNKVMWRADALTCVSKDMVKQYQTIFKQGKHVDVYNIIDDIQSRKSMMELVDHPWLKTKEVPILIAAGRLAPWKGFSDLIRAIKEVSLKRKVRLLILGDGPLKSELNKLILDLDLTHSIQLLGYVENPLKYFSKADVFILSSLVEGMPNVLVEAMMCGCTPVATDCPTGPRELLDDGRYGYLVPMNNINALSNGIIQAIDNPISKELLNKAIEPFHEKKVINRHFETLGIKVI